MSLLGNVVRSTQGEREFVGVVVGGGLHHIFFIVALLQPELLEAKEGIVSQSLLVHED